MKASDIKATTGHRNICEYRARSNTETAVEKTTNWLRYKSTGEDRKNVISLHGKDRTVSITEL